MPSCMHTVMGTKPLLYYVNLSCWLAVWGASVDSYLFFLLFFLQVGFLENHAKRRLVGKIQRQNADGTQNSPCSGNYVEKILHKGWGLQNRTWQICTSSKWESCSLLSCEWFFEWTFTRRSPVRWRNICNVVTVLCILTVANTHS